MKVDAVYSCNGVENEKKLVPGNHFYIYLAISTFIYAGILLGSYVSMTLMNTKIIKFKTCMQIQCQVF